MSGCAGLGSSGEIAELWSGLVPADGFDEEMPAVVGAVPLFKQWGAFACDAAKGERPVGGESKSFPGKHDKATKMNDGIVFKIRLPLGAKDSRLELRFGINKKFRKNLHPDVIRIPGGRQLGPGPKHNVLSEKIMAPNQKDIGADAIKCIKENYFVGRLHARPDGVFYCPQRDNLPC